MRKDKKDFFDRYSPEARAILNELLEKYAEHGTAQFVIPDALKVPPISERGNVMEIAGYFGGAAKLKEAVEQAASSALRGLDCSMKTNKKVLDDLLADLKSGLTAIYGERLKGLYLYGSYARGEEDEESDLDILVVLKHFETYAREVDITSELGSSLSLKYEITVSKVFVREVEWLQGDTPFLSNVREEAISF